MHKQIATFYMVLELIAKEGKKGTSSKITTAWSVGASPSPVIKETFSLPTARWCY